MPRVKKTKIPTIINNANILVYDNENMVYCGGVLTGFDYEPIYQTYDNMHGYKEHINLGANITARVPNFETFDNITLDETTMKRIAKFNKTRECAKLDKEIEKKKKEIEELDDILQDKSNRVKKIKEYIMHIYDIDLDDDDDEYEGW